MFDTTFFYLLRSFLRSFFMALAILILLFLVFDFFERIDNILAEDTDFSTAFSYFLYKTPLITSLMIPVAAMIGVILSLGVLSKNSEITALRAAGYPLLRISAPYIFTSFFLSLFALLINETIVPTSQRRVREIYNLDIKKKDESGSYSQSDLWWRFRDTFYKAEEFDSRSNQLQDISGFRVNQDFIVNQRTDASNAEFVSPSLGWNMSNIVSYKFHPDDSYVRYSFDRLPLHIPEQPQDFYDVRTDPYTMSYMELKNFINKQKEGGMDAKEFMAYLYEKVSFPLITVVVVLCVIPFSLIPARSGSLALTVLAGLVFGFSYYAVHSFSIALGRAELLNPLLSAWLANILMTSLGGILLLGSESPS